MADPLLTVAFDASSMATIARMLEFEAILTAEMSGTMTQIGDLLVPAMQANTQTAFQNPTGELSDSISPLLKSPWEVDITVDVPYAWRMEEGFHGADSLGRVYNQEAEPYAQPALDDNQDAIIALMDQGILATWAKVGGV